MKAELPDLVKELRDYLGPIEEALQEELDPLIRTWLVAIKGVMEQLDSLEVQMALRLVGKVVEEVMEEFDGEEEESPEEESSEEDEGLRE